MCIDRYNSRWKAVERISERKYDAPFISAEKRVHITMNVHTCVCVCSSTTPHADEEGLFYPIPSDSKINKSNRN